MNCINEIIEKVKGIKQEKKKLQEFRGLKLHVFMLGGFKLSFCNIDNKEFKLSEDMKQIIAESIKSGNDHGSLKDSSGDKWSWSLEGKYFLGTEEEWGIKSSEAAAKKASRAYWVKSDCSIPDDINFKRRMSYEDRSRETSKMTDMLKKIEGKAIIIDHMQLPKSQRTKQNQLFKILDISSFGWITAYNMFTGEHKRFPGDSVIGIASESQLKQAGFEDNERGYYILADGQEFSDVNVEGRVLILAPNLLPEEDRIKGNQLWRAVGGRGCLSRKDGEIYARRVYDGLGKTWKKDDFIAMVPENSDICIPDITYSKNNIFDVLELLLKDHRENFEKKRREYYKRISEAVKKYFAEVTSLNFYKELREFQKSQNPFGQIETLVARDILMPEKEYSREARMILKDNTEEILEGYVQEDVLSMYPPFIEKQSNKLLYIIKDRKYEVKATIDDNLESYFWFKLDDGTKFEMKCQIVWKTSQNGTEFYQFPTTFHNAFDAKGNKISVPSQTKLEALI